MTKLAIIIVNYNSSDYLIRCLHSIEQHSGDVPLQIVVVDNASDPPQRQQLPTPGDGLTIVLNDENVGFSTACNQGIRACDAAFYLLLNPDVELQPSSLPACLSFLEDHPETGIVGCKVLNPDGTLQLASRRSIPTPETALYRLLGLSLLFPKSPRFARYNMSYLDENSDCPVEAVSGSFLLFRKAILADVDGLDEDFFLYGEDLDFCLRTTQAGWKIYFFAGASVTHHKSRSADRNSHQATFHYWDAMRIFYLKHGGSSDGVFRRTLILTAIGALHWLKRIRQRFSSSGRVASDV